MDFEMHYTEEQEDLRKEVSDWLDQNVPTDFKPRPDYQDISPEEIEWAREFQRKLGAKGWRAPTWPKEYGGGGLPVESAIVIAEELGKRPIPQVYDLGISLCAPAVLVWGTEEQKQRILPRVLRGEAQTWQLMSEPEAGTDLASLKTRAIREGDEYVVNGQKLWVGGTHPVDYFYLLAVTDPEAPRHRNLSAFYIPADLPGITITPIDMVCHHKNMVFFDNVRVPADTLIGGENDGWRVAQATLEVEHGGGQLSGFGELTYKLIDYAKNTMRSGERLSADPAKQEIMTKLYIDTQIGRLFNVRNYWMRHARVPFSRGEGTQNALYGKVFMHRLAKDVLDVVGPYAMITDEQWAPLNGILEHDQRYSLSTHAGGTPEAQKISMSRRLGLGRTPQKPAETY